MKYVFKVGVALFLSGLMMHAMEPETFIERVDEQRNVALSMIGNFLLNQQIPKTLSHDDTVYTTAISPDSKHIATGSFDSTVKVWDKNGKLEHVLKGSQALINLVVISPDNTYVATGAFDKSEQEIDRTVKIWDMQTSTLLHTLGEKEVDRHLTSITALAISPNNAFVVSGSADHAIKIWDTKTGQLMYCFAGSVPNTPSWTANWINEIVISSDSAYVVAGTNLGQTVMIDMKSGQINKVMFRHPPVNGQVAKIISMALAGKKLVTGSWDGTARLWDITNDTLLHTFGAGIKKVLSVDISRDGAYVAVAPADDDNIAKVWNANTGQLKCILGGLGGHTDLIKKVKISADNRYVVTASNDKTVRVWGLAQCKLLNVFSGHNQNIESLDISPDTTYVVSGSYDHTARIWSLLLDLTTPEFNIPNSALVWIKDTITIDQAGLIARVYAATGEGQVYTITQQSDDALSWTQFPKIVCDYLLEKLKIELSK